MDKFSLFLESSDKNGFLKSIFESPFESTAKLAFADWLDENGMPLEAEFLRLSASYQKQGNSWHSLPANDPKANASALKAAQRYHKLESQLKNKIIKSGYKIYANHINKSGKNLEHLTVTSTGVYKYDEDKGYVPADIDKLDEKMIDAIIYVISSNSAPMVHGAVGSEESWGLVSTLHTLMSSLRFMIGDHGVMSDINLNNFIYAAKNMLTVLDHKPELSNLHIDEQTRQTARQLLNEFSLNVTNQALAIRGMGFKDREIISLASRLLERFK